MRQRALLSRVYRIPLAEVGKLTLGELDALSDDLSAASRAGGQ